MTPDASTLLSSGEGERDYERGDSPVCSGCHKRKKPLGRSAPLEMANGLCDHECEGYMLEPKPHDLWPGETREEFGYPGPSWLRGGAALGGERKR